MLWGALDSMVRQHVFADESSAAVGAVERLLGAVSIHVVLPVGAIGKFSLTSGALELFRVLAYYGGCFIKLLQI